MRVRDIFKIDEINEKIDFKPINISKRLILKIFNKKLEEFQSASNDKKKLFLRLIKLSERLETPKEIDFFKNLSKQLTPNQKDILFEKCLKEHKVMWKNLRYFATNENLDINNLLIRSSEVYEGLEEAQKDKHGIEDVELRGIIFDLLEINKKNNIDSVGLYKSVFFTDSKYYLEEIDEVEKFKNIYGDSVFKVLDCLVGFYLKNHYDLSNLKNEVISNKKISIFTRYLVKQLKYVYSTEYSNLNTLSESYKKAQSNLESVFKSAFENGDSSRFDFWIEVMTKSDKYLLNKINASTVQIAFFYNNIVFLEVSQAGYSTCLFKKDDFENFIQPNKDWHYRGLSNNLRSKVVTRLDHKEGWQYKYRVVINEHYR